MVATKGIGGDVKAPFLNKKSNIFHVHYNISGDVKTPSLKAS
jgi:hypothetical protein